MSVARKKPVKKPVREIISPKGGAALTPGNPGNAGGKKGRSGRKPDEYRELCADLLNSVDAKRSVESILKDDRHPHFASMYKHLAEYAHGKPVQAVTHSQDEDSPPFRFTLDLGSAAIHEGDDE